MYFFIHVPQRPMISWESHSEIPLNIPQVMIVITSVGGANYVNNNSPLF